MQFVADSTDVSTELRAVTAAGTPLEGKVAADFALWYRRDFDRVDLVLSDIADLADPHTDGGVKEIGDGWYRLDLPDAAFANGANRVAIGGSVAGGIVISAPIGIEPVPEAIGALSVTITVVDGDGDPLENAKVRLTEGVNAAWAETDENGVGVLRVDAATWSVGVTKDGYSYYDGTLEVTGDTTAEIELSALSIAPSEPGLTTVYWLVKLPGGTLAGEGEAVMDVGLLSGPGTDGLAHGSTPVEYETDAAGMIQVPNVYPGSKLTCRLRGPTDPEIGTRPWTTVTIPAAAGENYAAGEVVGRI